MLTKKKIRIALFILAVAVIHVQYILRSADKEVDKKSGMTTILQVQTSQAKIESP